MKALLLLSFIIFGNFVCITAQEFIEFTGNGWGQGITNSKIAVSDINGDGIKDMLVGSKNGCLLHFEISSEPPYEISMITNKFNNIDVGWDAAPVLIDLDNNGLLDLLIGKGSGEIDHWEQASALSTTFNYITYDFNDISSHNWENITLAFCDIDSDNKLDMAVGHTFGLFHYEQESIGSLSFEPVSPNFGNINTDLWDPVPTFYDIDGDDKIDLLLGKNNFGGISHYEQGEPSSASFFPVNHSLFGLWDIDYLSPYIYDLDDDGILELIIGEHNGQLRLYQQIEQNSNQFGLLTETMNKFDVGILSTPTIKDINNDGLYDLIVGNYGPIWHFIQSEDNDKIIIPESQNFLGIQQSGFTIPCFTDIDNDNLDDILIANESEIKRFEQESPNSFVFLSFGALGTIEIGFGIKNLSIIDFENNGLLDLIYTAVEYPLYFVLKHYQQTSMSSDQFEHIGDFYTSYPDNVHSANFGDIDNDGLLDQLDASSSSNWLNRSEQSSIGSLSFNYIGHLQDIYGDRLAPSLYDIDNDGDLDLIIGSHDGGLRLFENKPNTSVPIVETMKNITIGTSKNNILIKQSQNEKLVISVYNLSGKEVKRYETNLNKSTFSIKGAESIYIVKIIGNKNSAVKKIIIN